MPRLKAANNASTTLAAGITAGATSLTVADASRFPETPFRVTIESEIMEVTNKNGSTFTVLRAQENTEATAHASGQEVRLLWTAGMYAELETSAGAQAKVDAHAALTAPHNATSEAIANRLIIRDANGRAQVAAPTADADIARKDTVDAVQANLTVFHRRVLLGVKYFG